MALPSPREIFIDFGEQGLATTLREFLGYFVKQFWPGVNTQIEKLYFTRIDYPLLVLPVFLLAFIGLYSFWEKPTRMRAVLAALPAGALLYTYFHSWVYWVIVVGFLFGYALVFWRVERKRVVGFLVYFSVLATAAIPLLLTLIQFSQVPGYQDFMHRLWVAEGREPGLRALGFAYLVYLLIAIAVWRTYRGDRARVVFFLVLLAAMAAVWNVQVITGIVPAPDHWKRIISPVLFIIAFILIHEWSRRAGERHAFVAALIPLLVVTMTVLAVSKKIVNIIAMHRSLAPWVIEKYAFPQELLDSWRWMNEYLAGEPKVISASTMTSQYLIAYTAVRPYVPYSILSALPMAEFEKRFLEASRLFNVSEEVLAAELAGDGPPVPCSGNHCFDVENNFRKMPFNLYTCFFDRGTFNDTLYHRCEIPAPYQREMLERYRRTRVTWSDVDADYVYVGPHERQLGDVDFRRDPALTLIYENPLVEIYRINRR